MTLFDDDPFPPDPNGIKPAKPEPDGSPIMRAVILLSRLTGEQYTEALVELTAAQKSGHLCEAVKRREKSVEYLKTSVRCNGIIEAKEINE